MKFLKAFQLILTCSRLLDNKISLLYSLTNSVLFICSFFLLFIHICLLPFYKLIDSLIHSFIPLTYFNTVRYHTTYNERIENHEARCLFFFLKPGIPLK